MVYLSAANAVMAYVQVKKALLHLILSSLMAMLHMRALASGRTSNR
jgi:hypothetical protein